VAERRAVPRHERPWHPVPPMAAPSGWAWHPQRGWVPVPPVAWQPPAPAPRSRRSHPPRRHRRGHGAGRVLAGLALLPLRVGVEILRGLG